MATSDVFSTTVTLLRGNERNAVVQAGLPSRQVILPIALVDFECIRGDTYRVTMHKETAKDAGLDL